MKAVPRISDAEWEIMKILWTRAPLSAGEIIESLSRADSPWHPKTVKTFLTRLVNKRVVDFKKEGRAYLYFPTVTEQQCVDAASASFLARVFGGSLRPMLAHFVEHKKLTAEEIKELKKILEEGNPDDAGVARTD